MKTYTVCDHNTYSFKKKDKALRIRRHRQMCGIKKKMTDFGVSMLILSVGSFIESNFYLPGLPLYSRDNTIRGCFKGCCQGT